MASAGSQGSYGWNLAVYELVYKSNFLDELLHDTPATVQGNNPAVLYKVERQHVWFFFTFTAMRGNTMMEIQSDISGRFFLSSRVTFSFRSIAFSFVPFHTVPPGSCRWTLSIRRWTRRWTRRCSVPSSIIYQSQPPLSMRVQRDARCPAAGWLWSRAAQQMFVVPCDLPRASLKLKLFC